MDRTTRSAIERATQIARHLLEDEFEAQLEGTFDILSNGSVAEQGGPHLTARQAFEREVLVAAIERKGATGLKPADAVADYLRDAAFTLLNRFVALKMLEARGLVQQCVSRGPDSTGYDEFAGMAPGLPLLPDGQGYRLYLESLFDELSTEVKVLFDRRDPAGVLWPRRLAFEALLDTLNGPELDGIWADDETIGWVYQYFNGGDERKKMRDESQAPRNSRELAVRNQFFTPRYVVQFLADNTLGRTWVEMHGEGTGLLESCEFLVRPIDEPFGTRSRKDPRDLRILDPACGSGHFLLYSFDLLLSIYEEAWAAADAAPASDLTGRTLRADYADLAHLREAAPGLIVEHNLYGVDIDARCAQIAALALWLRAQRAYQDLGLKADARPRIERTHIVIAEPMPDDRELAAAFAGELEKPFQQALFSRMIEEMRLAGELGTLLQVELSLADDIRRARRQYLAEQERPSLFPDLRPKTEQGKLDLSGVTDEAVFQDAEGTILAALERFAESAGGADARRRLFAGDAAHGVALIDLVRTRFDVVLMNPPFGLMPRRTYDYLVAAYPYAYYDLAVAFQARGLMLLAPGGLCGAITTRAFQTVVDAAEFREHVAIPSTDLLVDLGSGVMDGAAVDASAQVMSNDAIGNLRVIDLRTAADKASELAIAVESARAVESFSRDAFRALPSHRIAYDALRSLSHVYSGAAGGVEPEAAIARIGASTFDDERFLRCRWEVAPADMGTKWMPSSRSAEEFSLYYYPPTIVVNWAKDGREVCARNEQVNGSQAQARQGSTHYGRPGLVFSRRSSPSIAFRAHPSGSAFASNTGVVIPVAGTSVESLLGFLNSTPVRAAVNALSNRDSYTVGHIKRIRWPAHGAAEWGTLDAAALRILATRHWLFRLQESDPWFQLHEVLGASGTCEGSYREYTLAVDRAQDQLVSDYTAIENVVSEALRITDLENVRAQFQVEPADILKPARLFKPDQKDWVVRCVVLAFGVAIGRWSSHARLLAIAPSASLGSIPVRAPGPTPGSAFDGVLVDDPGHPRDVVTTMRQAWSAIWPDDPPLSDDSLRDHMGRDLREWISSTLFTVVRRMYSSGKRSAPVYVQLGVPSGKYSVWLHVADLTSDSLFRLQADIVGPKVALEERRLVDLAKGTASPEAPAATRAAVADQERFVDELRVFARDLGAVLAIWKPDFDDGIPILAAPLWKLMTEREWQKHLLGQWRGLIGGDYDWARTAMRLWPERVVPKCATDRSLAIAHGLEDVFWAEGADGKSAKRVRPTRSIEDLVAERSRPAVKEALAKLLAYPDTVGGRSRGMKGE